MLFERDGPSIDFGATVTQRTRAGVIEDLLTDDTLFLAVAAWLTLDQYQPVAEWFHQSLLFVRPSSARKRRDERLARFIGRSESDRVRFLDLARVADVGISDIAVEYYVDDPRAAEEADALQTMVERLEVEMADADQERLDLAEELGRVRSRMDSSGVCHNARGCCSLTAAFGLSSATNPREPSSGWTSSQR